MECSQEILSDTITVCKAIADSVTTSDALFKYHELYNTSFKNLQESFSAFINTVNVIVVIIGVIVSAVGLGIVLLSFINYKHTSSLRKEMKMDIEKQREEFAGIKKRVSDLENNLNNEFEKIKGQFKEIEKQADEQKKESQHQIENVTEVLGNGFYIFLKKIAPIDFSINIEIIIESERLKKVENNYESNADDYKNFYNRIDRYNKKSFRIVILGRAIEEVPYEKVDYWEVDESQKDKEHPDKIHVYFKKPVILYPGEKVVIEDR